jgi:hypothetical protein
MRTRIFGFLILTSFLSITTFLNAQNSQRGKMKDNIESMKIAFITNKLDLTPEEAQQFWPIYNQYSDKTQELRMKRKMENKQARHNFEEMSDKEVEQSVDNEIVYRQKELDIQKEYHTKFKAVLPIKKVAKLYQAEEQFKRVLLDKLKKDQPPVKSVD